MKVVLENVREKREAWLKLKENTIGSSEIATICGMNDYESPVEFFYRRQGRLPAKEMTDPMWLGIQMEPTVGALFARKTGFPIESANIMAVHPVHEWMSASPDFWTFYEEEKRILEAKYTTWRNRKIWENGLPDAYVIQNNWQLGVCELTSGHIAGMIGDDLENMPHGPVSFSAELFDFCAERGEEFRRMLESDTPPQAREGDDKIIAKIQGKRIDEPVELPEKASDLADRFVELKAKESKANKEAKEAKEAASVYSGRLLQLMGNSTVGILPGGRVVTAKTRGRAEFVSRATSWVEVKVI